MSISVKPTDEIARAPGIRILFLEDDHGLRHALTDFLRLNAMAVTDVASIAEFDKAVIGKEFDVAILDIGLPDGDGYDAVHKLRHNTRVGIIVLTARASRSDRLKGYQEGADLYFTKPVDGTELVLAIRNLTSRLQGTGGAAVGPTPMGKQQHWRLDIARHHLVAPSDVVLRLSGREMKLLMRLSTQNGEVVSREELATVMGYENLTAESRRVDAVLRRLRNKARAAQLELPIHAVHARGFRFSTRLDVS